MVIENFLFLISCLLPWLKTQTASTEKETEMLINELKKAINDSVNDWKDYLKEDAKAAHRMAEIGGGQKGFNEWLIERIKVNGQDGWWYPSTLFRSFNLKGQDKGVEEANRIRAQIRAATDGRCPFIGRQAWNKKDNKEIFHEWIAKNNHLVEQALKQNEGNPESTSTNSISSNYIPTKEDCEAAIQQLNEENVAARTGQVLDRIEKNMTSRGMALKPSWRMITEKNMKNWSS
jgi:hypothetical protein